MKNLDLKWYVLNHDFVTNEIKKFNIFDSVRFSDGVEKELKKFVDYNSFKDELDSLLKYCFWSKAEYEIVCHGLFVENPSDMCKIDVYEQVAPNLDILTHYIIDAYNNAPHRKKKLEEENNL